MKPKALKRSKIFQKSSTDYFSSKTNNNQDRGQLTFFVENEKTITAQLGRKGRHVERPRTLKLSKNGVTKRRCKNESHVDGDATI